MAVSITTCSAPPSQPAATAPTHVATTHGSSTFAATVAPTTAELGLLQVLVLHATAGFEHDSIPAGIMAITTLGSEHGFTVKTSEDSSALLDPGVAELDVIVFLSTTGDILDAGEERAMEKLIQSGKGFVGIHSATDTEYDWAWYGGLVGAYFEGHPAVQPATIRSSGAGHPAGDGLPATFERVDEWYNFRSPPGPGVVVLATLDESTYEGGTMGDNHPIAWVQEYDGGRSFYTGGGHTVESYSEPLFRDHLATGILWAAGRS
ncbi:MAG: ThuA domain-containing protein [Acidimicrobiia bacterium]